MEDKLQTKHFLSFVLTNRCNLNCIYCYEKHKHIASIDTDTVKQIIERYLNDSKYEEVEIDFFGGEPFLEFDKIKEICEWTWSRKWSAKYLFFATTNGTILTNEIKDWLRANKQYFWVSLSLDGTRDTHNLNRSNSFDRIDISFFKECWPEQSVKMTISKQRIEYLYDDIVFIHSLGFNIAGTNFAEGIDWEDTKYKQVVFEQLEKLCNYYIEHPQITPAPILNMAIHKCAENEKSRGKWCGCGQTMSVYETDGKCYPCTFFTPMTFEEAQQKEIAKIDFTNDEEFIDCDCFNDCYIEPVCNNCYGANMLATGCVNKRDKSKCTLMKIRALFTAALKAHKLQQNPEDTYENALSVKAILKINELYNGNI